MEMIYQQEYLKYYRKIRRIKMKKSKLVGHYSGKRSEKFWDKITKLQGKEHDFLYSMGVFLQDIEGRILQYLNSKEK